MDNLQYLRLMGITTPGFSFKPCYKWITSNTEMPRPQGGDKKNEF